MALESKPLFHPEVIRQPVRAFSLPAHVSADKPESPVAETQHLARRCERKLAALAAWKKSLRHQAFTGKL